MVSNSWDELEDKEKKRLEQLRKDQTYVVQTEIMRRSLQRVRQRDTKVFDRVFRKFGMQFDHSNIEAVLAGVSDAQMKKVVRDYAAYIARFRVVLSARAGEFREVPLPPFEQMYRAQVVDGHLRPIEKVEEPVYDLMYLADPPIDLPDALRSMVDRGEANVVELMDGGGRSLLDELADLSYHPERLTFIIFHGEQDYLLCLVGEKLPTNTIWRSGGKVITQVQKKFYGRSKAGRPHDTELLNQAIELDQKPGTYEEKAHQLTPAPRSAAQLASATRRLRDVSRKLIPVNKKRR